jgi:LPXTG-site transpeptidase (sortase) family protein
MNPIDDKSTDANPAADLIRQKLSSLYAEEPTAKEEAAEVAALDKPLSKHQAFMYELNHSGKSLPEVQTAWHAYYQGLDDAGKHEVWEEFYRNHPAKVLPDKPESLTTQAVEADKPSGGYYKRPRPTRPVAFPTTSVVGHIDTPLSVPTKKHLRDTRSVADVKRQILAKVRTRQKLKAKHHLQSLAFGLGVGSLVMLILLFGFFNERFIAPFITPSRQVSAAPIIIDESSNTVGPNPEVIIPKINVEIPVVYDEPSIADAPVEAALERGVVHYATTPSPGQVGNVVIFGHSSNNIFNQGRYKFAFVLLSRLEAGDVFYLTKDGKRYAYRVYDKRIVAPTEVDVLGPAGKPNTATLITCDPPGTSRNRLVVTGEQISPDPNGNTASTAIKTTQKPTVVPSNSPSLWSHLTNWL